MKVIDLIFEKEKLENTLSKSEYFMDCGCENKEQAAKVKRRFEEDQHMLKKLDAVNNAICGSDAATYVEVEGCRLSVATARMYLREISNGDASLSEVFDGDDTGCFTFRGNSRVNFFEKCVRGKCMHIFPEREYTDPVGLVAREDEFRRKKMDWITGLRKAVAVSDATTEVSFTY